MKDSFAKDTQYISVGEKTSQKVGLQKDSHQSNYVLCPLTDYRERMKC